MLRLFDLIFVLILIPEFTSTNVVNVNNLYDVIVIGGRYLIIINFFRK